MGTFLSKLAKTRSLISLSSCVYVHPTLSHGLLGDPVELRVAPPEAQHSAGAIVWGQGASADTLFASSESHIMTDNSGYHVAFDPDQGRRAYEFSARESGDAMSLDPDGSAIRVQSQIPKQADHSFFPQVRGWPYAPPR